MIYYTFKGNVLFLRTVSGYGRMMKKVGKDCDVCCVKVSDGEIMFRKTDEFRWSCVKFCQNFDNSLID